jgi:hypothetical protein
MTTLNFAGRGQFGRGISTCTTLLLAGTALAAKLNAGQLNHGDLVVADSQATVYSLNSATGARSIIAQGGKLDRPYGLVLDRHGNIITSDTGTLRIVQINPVNGQQTVLAEGAALGVPYGIDVDQQSGRIYVANSSAVLRIGTKGTVETVAQGGFLQVPLDVAVASDGTLYVADALAGVVRIDPVTKNQTLVSQGNNLKTPTGISLDGNGSAYVVDGGGKCIVAVDLPSGAQRLVTAGGYLTTPVGIALGASGTMLVSDPDAFDLDGGIFRIGQDGTQTPVARGSGDLVNARGIAIVP